MKKEIKLPDKPSDLIELALRDFDSCRTDRGYVIDMDFLHYYDESESKCHVNFAGSLMAKTLKANPRGKFGYKDFTGDQGKKIDFLQKINQCEIIPALKNLVPKQKMKKEELYLGRIDEKYKLMKWPMFDQESFGFTHYYDLFVRKIRVLINDLIWIGL